MRPAYPPRYTSSLQHLRGVTFYQDGTASWYGPNFVGRPTANGEIFDPSQLTAAHQTLPFDTLVRVTHLDNGRSVVVRINDRGPFVGTARD